MIRRPPRSTLSSSSAASDVYKRQINFSEADKSFGALSDKDKERILLRVNSIYKTIGEPLVELEAKPTVYVGDCLL